MPSTDSLSKSGVIFRANIPTDVMTFWVRHGVLRPIEAATGTGRHLRFPWYEANIAAVMSELRQFGVPREGLLQIADTFRQAIAWAERYELTRDDVFALQTVFTTQAIVVDSQVKRAELRALVASPGFDREAHPRLVEAAEPYSAAEEVQDMLLPWTDEKHGAQRVTGRIIEIWTKMPKDEFRRHYDPYATITEQPKPTDSRAQYAPDMSYFWRAGDEWKFAHGEDGPHQARRDGSLSTIAIDVSTVIYDVWTRGEDPQLGLEPAE